MRKLFFVFILAAGLTSCVMVEAQTQSPNIVFVMADDLGIGDVGAYGQTLIRTPNLDQLAQEGVKFTDFYAGSTVCAPSRAALMTGQHTGHGHVRGNGEYPLDPSQKIMPEYLKMAGYNTAMFGKWGLGQKETESSPEKRGWDVFAGFLHHVDAHYQHPDSIDMIVDGKIEKLPVPGGMYANDYFAQRAGEFISDQTADKPFFLYLSYTVPHAELILDPEALSMYLDEEGNSVFPDEVAWPDGRHYGPQEYPKAAYAAMVSHMDQQVGGLMKLLKEKGLEENTIFIFTSDNGTHTEGGRTDKDIEFFSSSSLYRGKKRDLYEGGVHVPFLLKWPAQVKAGTVSDHRASFYDLPQTFSDLAQISTQDNLDGQSMAPLLTGIGEQPVHEYLYWEFHEQGGKQAILKDQWKVIRLEVGKNPSGAVELYDLENDPSETENVASRYPAKAAELTEILDGIRTPNPIFNFGIKK